MLISKVDAALIGPIGQTFGIKVNKGETKGTLQPSLIKKLTLLESVPLRVLFSELKGWRVPLRS
jgi:hypothetical protein